MENPCCSVRDGVGFPSLKINERLIPAHLTMLDEKECYSSHLSSGWHGFSSLDEKSTTLPQANYFGKNIEKNWGMGRKEELKEIWVNMGMWLQTVLGEREFVEMEMTRPADKFYRKLLFCSIHNLKSYNFLPVVSFAYPICQLWVLTTQSASFVKPPPPRPDPDKLIEYLHLALAAADSRWTFQINLVKKDKWFQFG